MCVWQDSSSSFSLIDSLGTLLDGVQVLSHSLISDSIVGWHSKVGRWVRPALLQLHSATVACVQSHLVNLCVLGEDVRVGEGLYLNGTVVCPHKSVKTTILQEKQIVI